MLIRKRGQAAMEFLMTYGWAILVVLVVIGALSYFGVLNPQSFLPKKCQFSTGLVCTAHQVFSNGGMQIQINNGLGNDIGVKVVSFESDNNIIKCTTAIDTSTKKNGITIPAGVSTTFKMAADSPCGKEELDSFKGARIKGKLNIKYIDLQTQFEHNQPGTLLTDVEEGTLPADATAAPVTPATP